ncbi:hypothetical protein H257_14526 [Aphanomyces astaci]|uniref:DNA 5'-3' helicase n=2 Tax=Aphanomyces astaci TaxID=112090 RepID=W4FSV0_APHAT|nr:hypothetical protein H257_14526 [Aphanomyces astaci]ETV69929.1 hypothetical protein H257_14526 [Aphanomyces astaci]|eukprot:XP_009840667.1 hypothetical protein H257_14526 [Aphanomyces astaci]
MSDAKRQKVHHDADDGQSERDNAAQNPFSFPFPPYSIQEDLMKQIYDTISQSKIGIFESPTGTGKSLSLICGVLTWLRDHTDANGVLLPDKADEVATTDSASIEPSWMRNFHAPAQSTSERALNDVCAKLAEIRANPTHSRIRDTRLMHGAGRTPHGPKPSTTPTGATSGTKHDDGDEVHIVPAYESGNDAAKDAGSSDDDDDDDDSTNRFNSEPTDYNVVQIFYCSRTHSQLSQFMQEIKKTSFAKSIRTLTLGARKSLCIHPDVRKLTSDTAMTDKCLDLIQSTKTKAPGCPYNKRTTQVHFRHHALAQVQDIEELHDLGQQMSSCSYYGTRSAIPLAQVIAMPYSMLLSKSTRESLGIHIKGSIVILDEAHNIADAVNNTYSVTVSGQHLIKTRRQVWSYFQRYEKRLQGRNVYYIKQLLAVLQHCHKFLTSKISSSNAMFTITDFLFEAKMDNINLFKIQQYLERSKLAQKLLGFVATEDGGDGVTTHVSPLRTIGAFFMALTTATANGRILVMQQEKEDGGKENCLKFMLLNPALHFADIVAEAKSVILAGGTMQPVSQVLHSLLLGVDRERIDLFSCGHIIPPANLTAVALGVGPTNTELDFTFSKRNTRPIMDEVGRIVLNLVRVVPGGVVVFFPSYSYENQVILHWKSTGVLAAIEAKKMAFREPKSTAEVDAVLTSYAAACQEFGAILFSVVGGKMSEGINFSNELARCVVMVGLPYPNPHDPELMQQMEYTTKSVSGVSAHDFYSNLCMKAVNQSIGRSIRHRNDYASIMLLDRRYNTNVIRSRLPKWINDRTVTYPTFGPMIPHLVQFYKQHRPANTTI